MTLPTQQIFHNQTTHLSLLFATTLLTTTLRQLGQGSRTRTRTTTMLTKDQKIFFLRMLLERKDIALGKFSPIVTSAAKRKAWDEMAEELRAQGADVDGSDLRRTVFQNMKKGLTAKMDHNGKTGSGKAKKLSEIEELLMQIIGQDSGKLRPLDIDDSQVIFSSFVPVVCTQSSAAGDGAINHYEDAGPSNQNTRKEDDMDKKKEKETAKEHWRRTLKAGRHSLKLKRWRKT